jgi:hypothetical protein
MKTQLFRLSICLLIIVLVQLNVFSKSEKNYKYKKSVIMSHAIEVPLSIDSCYNFIINDFSSVYQEISSAHEYFTVKNEKSLELGSVIDCAENSEDQFLVHEYIVKELVENKHIFYASIPTNSQVHLKNKVIEGKSNTYVFWDFNENDYGKTNITITVIVQFDSALQKVFINLVGGMKPWKKHCVEEMEGLKRVLTI